MRDWKNFELLYESNETANKRQQIKDKLLLSACISGDKVEVNKALLSGANINAYIDNTTPLIAAMSNDRSLVVEFLIQSGAFLTNYPSINTENAFWYTIYNNKVDYLQIMVNKGVLLPKSLLDEEPPLVYATRHSNLNLVRLLLSSKHINVQQTDKNGNTALHHNVSKDESTRSSEDNKIGVLLIAAGADIYSENLDGKKPSDLATAASAIAFLEKEIIKDVVAEKTKQNTNTNTTPTTPKRLKL